MVTQNPVAFKILAVCLCIFSSTSMAFDLGGVMKQVQQAVQGQVPPQPTAKNPVELLPPVDQQANDGNAVLPVAGTDMDPCRIAERKDMPRQSGQSMQDFIEQGNKKKAARAACENKKAAAAATPNYVETSEALELKGVRIGMAEQDLLKLLPQGIVVRPRPQTEDWVNGDTIILYGSGTTECDSAALQRNNLGKNCSPYVLMTKNAFAIELYFLDNKLAYGELHFSRTNAVESDSRFAEDNERFYFELLEGLSKKFKASPVSKETDNGRGQYRTVGWKNNSCKCELILLEDNGYSGSSGKSVVIKLMSDEYPDVFESRAKLAQAAAAKAQEDSEKRIKGDL